VNGDTGTGKTRLLNRVEAVRIRSKYTSDIHPVIAIDGVPLDLILDTALPRSNLEGLVPSLLGWFHDAEDAKVPWQRILPDVGCTGYAPILICPDDLDFSCAVVVAEVVAKPDVVRWDRLGFDASTGTVGSCIRWEPALGPYTFRRDEYERMLAAFERPAV
jgi:hypothetical protein